MKAKALVSVALATLVAAALIAPSGAALAAKKKAPKGPVVVGTDPSGDWGAAVDPTIAPIGDALGMDLTEASIEMADATTINFIIKLNSLPPSGGFPEIPRYIWDFNVGDEFTELDGKFTNYSRGACDPTSGACPPPRDPGLHPFLVRGNCGIASDTGTAVTTCEEIGLVEAVFDAAAGTITIPVPMEVIGAKKGSKITGATNLFGGSISASPSAFLSSSAFPTDSMTMLETFVVPKK